MRSSIFSRWMSLMILANTCTAGGPSRAGSLIALAPPYLHNSRIQLPESHISGNQPSCSALKPTISLVSRNLQGLESANETSMSSSTTPPSKKRLPESAASKKPLQCSSVSSHSYAVPGPMIGSKCFVCARGFSTFRGQRRVKFER